MPATNSRAHITNEASPSRKRCEISRRADAALGRSRQDIAIRLVVLLAGIAIVSTLTAQVSAQTKAKTQQKPTATATSKSTTESARQLEIARNALRDFNAAQSQFRLYQDSGEIAAGWKQALSAAEALKAAADAGVKAISDAGKVMPPPIAAEIKGWKLAYDATQAEISFAAAKNDRERGAAGARLVGAVAETAGLDAAASGAKAVGNALSATTKVDKGDQVGGGLSTIKAVNDAAKAIGQGPLVQPYEAPVTYLSYANDLVRAVRNYSAASSEGLEAAREVADFERRSAEVRARLENRVRTLEQQVSPSSTATSPGGSVPGRQNLNTTAPADVRRRTTETSPTSTAMQGTSASSGPGPIELLDWWRESGDRAFDNLPGTKERFYQMYPSLKARYGGIAATHSPASEFQQDVDIGKVNLGRLQNEAIVASETFARSGKASPAPAGQSRPASVSEQGGRLESFVDVGPPALGAADTNSSSMGSISLGDTGGIDLRGKQQYEAQTGLAAENDALWRQIQARKSATASNQPSRVDEGAAALSACQIELRFVRAGERDLEVDQQKLALAKTSSQRTDLKVIVKVHQSLLESERASLHACLARNPSR